MDNYCGFRYFWELREGKLEDDQIRADYEVEVGDDPLRKGRYRCCHALIDRNRPDSLERVKILEQKLFHQRPYVPSGQPVPAIEGELCEFCILSFTESLLWDKRNMNRSKFVIAVTFGVKRSEEVNSLLFMIDATFGVKRSEDEEEDDEVLELELQSEELELEDELELELELEMQLQLEELEDEEVEEEDEDTMEVEGNELGFVPASKSAIKALEKVFGVGSGECVICLGENSSEQKEAKRMPCGHVYHADCIVQWLEKSHLCPSCRYALPVDW